MTFSRKATIAGLIAALTATSGLAVAQDNSAAGGDAGTTVVAQAGEDDMPRMRGKERRAERMLERLDEDGSGDIGPDEFGQRRLGWLNDADANDDGVLSMEELTTAIDERRQERREARLLNRFDIDGDGEITLDELESQHEKRFALMDRDDDGALQADELPRRGGMRGGHHGRMMHHGGGMGGHHGR